MKQTMWLRLFFTAALCPVAAMKAGSLSGRSKDAGGPSPAPAVTNENEKIVIDNIQHDLEEAKDIPEPESDAKEAEGLGLGSLAKNLEFLMLKVAQLDLRWHSVGGVLLFWYFQASRRGLGSRE